MQNAAVTIGGTTWQVEATQTAAERALGLSGRASIPVGTGMLFDMGSQGIITITAEDMLFAFATVFFDENLIVTEIALITSPGETDLSTMYPAHYFMEVNLGELSGVSIGSTVVISGYSGGTSGIDISSLMNLMITMMIVVMMMKMMSGMMTGLNGSVSAPQVSPIPVPERKLLKAWEE